MVERGKTGPITIER